MKCPINFDDARRYLTEEEFEELECLGEMIELLKDGCFLLPKDQRRYEELSRKMERGRRSETEFEKYMRGVERDAKALQKLESKYYDFSPEDEDGAIDFLVSSLENASLLKFGNPADGLPGTSHEVKLRAKEIARLWEPGAEVLEYEEAFLYKEKAWAFPLPKVHYRKMGNVPALIWNFYAHAVITVEVWRRKHEKEFMGFRWIVPPSSSPISVFTHHLDPSLLEMKEPVAELTTSQSLLEGLMEGNLQPEGCEIVERSESTLAYRCEGFDEKVSLPVNFVDYLRTFEGEFESGRELLLELGLIDDLTAEILEDQPKRSFGETPKLRSKDLEYLEKMRSTDGFHSYGEWRNVLGVDRSSAYRIMERLEERNFVEREKHESGEGVRVYLTDKGNAALNKSS